MMSQYNKVAKGLVLNVVCWDKIGLNWYNLSLWPLQQLVKKVKKKKKKKQNTDIIDKMCLAKLFLIHLFIYLTICFSNQPQQLWDFIHFF